MGDEEGEERGEGDEADEKEDEKEDDDKSGSGKNSGASGLRGLGIAGGAIRKPLIGSEDRYKEIERRERRKGKQNGGL